jgi:hypothetical protein
MNHIKNGIIGRGLAGWHFTYQEKYSDSSCKVSSTGGALETYLYQAPDGTLVYDSAHCEEQAIFDYVFKGPMHDPCLDPISGKTKDYDPKDIKVKPIFGMPGSTGETMTFKEAAYLGSEAYLQFLKETVPGIKTGKVINKKIVWD